MVLIYSLSLKFSKKERKREFFVNLRFENPFKDIFKTRTLDDNFQSSMIEGQL